MASITMPIASVTNYKVSTNNYPVRLLATAASSRTSYNRSTSCAAVQIDVAPTDRRSGNYKPTIWNFDNIQLLSSEYMQQEKRHSERANELIEQVRKMLLEEEKEGVAQLELIDDLQMLGLSYHFQDEIDKILKCIYSDSKNLENGDLYSTALAFRLLREHGFKISQEVFDRFKNQNGDFSGDTKALFQLYEASFMLTQGETTLEKARDFSASFLQKKLDDDKIDEEYLSLLMRQSLEVPTHWRIQRPYAKWFMDVYEKKPNMNSNVLELAKLDFNILQASHQQELKRLSKWWKQTGLAETLHFARDRLVECYVWTMARLLKPEYENARFFGARVNVFITIIDDIYDVYGTHEELLLFNDIIQRWDVEAADQLPHYMKICFLALNNFVNEMAYDVLKEQKVLIIPYLRKSWADICGTYMQEAEWYYKKYTPTFDEYIKIAWVSISASVILSHNYFLMTNPIDKEVVESLYKYHNIVRCSGMILRLANDLGTSPYEMERGDVPKAVECYMNEYGCSREEAREYVKSVLWQTWKEMNEEKVAEDSPFSQDFIKNAADLGRMAQYMYRHGDGHGISNNEIKDGISTLLFDPIV